MSRPAAVIAQCPKKSIAWVTDSISDWFFCTEPAGVENLLREGQAASAIFHVGHVMRDNPLYQKQQLEKQAPSTFATTEYKNRIRRYGVVTLHRPSNVDDAEVFASRDRPGAQHHCRAIAPCLPRPPAHPGKLKARHAARQKYHPAGPQPC